MEEYDMFPCLKWWKTKESKKEQNEIYGGKNEYRLLFTNNQFIEISFCAFIVGFFVCFFLAILFNRFVSNTSEVRRFSCIDNSFSSTNIPIKNKRAKTVEIVDSNSKYIQE